MTAQLYFAYGSNLNTEDWRNWCVNRNKPPYNPDDIRRVGAAWLPDFELAFDLHSRTRGGGVLNIRPRVGQRVAGVLFEVLGQGWKALDSKEGAPKVYERFETEVIVPGGERLAAITYRASESKRQGFVRPTSEYLEIVRAGLRAHGLDPAMVDAAAGNAVLPMEIDAVFVYGTLMRGESRFSALAVHEPTCILTGYGPGTLYDLENYPGLVLTGQRELLVEGEFVQFERVEDALHALDAIEGFRGFGRPGSLYERTLVDVEVGEDRPRTAWTYVLPEAPSDVRAIPSSSWREERGRRKPFWARLCAAYAAGDESGLRALLRARGAWRKRRTTLADALDQCQLTERQLALATQRWVVVP
jgi:gamma-glutamylcyclotransferase (GGCT)/AIG2-like uncharacterized protein YtfP